MKYVNKDCCLRSVLGVLLVFFGLFLVLSVVSAVVQLPTLSVTKTVNPTTINEGDNATITFNLVGTGAPQTTRNNLDVMLVLDKSGSMSDNVVCLNYNGNSHCTLWKTKLDFAKEAAKTFVDQLDLTYDKSGLVSFSDSATLNQALTSNFTKVKGVIDSLSASGYTNVGDGIATATSQFTNSSHIRVQVLLSDGEANRPSNNTYAKVYALQKAQQALSSGIMIFTISLGSDADRALMQEIANMTGGREYYSPSASDLQGVFDEISEEVSNLTASNVIITDVLPVGVEPVNLGSSCSYNPTTRTVSCVVGLVSIGDDLTTSFDISVHTSGITHVNEYTDINYTKYDGTPNQQIVIDPQPTVTIISSCGNGILAPDEQCEAPFDACCDSLTCQFKAALTECRASAGQCDVAETCTGNSAACPQNGFAPQGTQCDDGLFCTVNDECDGAGTCSISNNRSCSQNDVLGIAACDNIPDGNPLTFDFLADFTSTCNEQTDSCTTGSDVVVSTCNTTCGGCVENADCDDNNDYTVDVCLNDCSCSHTQLECLSDSDCDKFDRNYCSEDSVMHDEGICVQNSCQTNTTIGVNCNENDKVYCNGTEIWRDNGYCSEGGCKLDRVMTQDCNDGAWCNGEETCSDSDGVQCVSGTKPDCSQNDISPIATCFNVPDENDLTFDFRDLFTSKCNEQTDSCTTGSDTITHTCDVECGAECASSSDCSATSCSSLDGCYFNVWRTYDNISGSCDLSTCGCIVGDCSFANYTSEADLDQDGYSASCGDCNDNDASVNPLALEVCDGVDNDCNGLVDDGLGTIPADNILGACSGNTKFCSNGSWIDSLTNYAPVAETGNGVDDNCNGQVDEGLGGGGSGGSSGGCTTQWTCTDWSLCDSSGIQTRICSYPTNFCKPKDAMPAISQSCTPTSSGNGEDNGSGLPLAGNLAPVTGGIIGALGVGGTIAAAGFIAAMILGAWWFAWKRRKKKKN